MDSEYDKCMWVKLSSKGRTGENLEKLRIYREDACEISATMIGMLLWPQEEITLVTAAARGKMWGSEASWQSDGRPWAVSLMIDKPNV